MWMWAALVAFGTVLASLYDGRLMWLSLAAMTLLTIVLTFLLPAVHKPRMAPSEP
jgi:UDP-GlcNAc:undecaprenyl-phosphate GlcNAc-1-phosphate transferase